MKKQNVTLEDIAKKTKLSKGAVSFALRNSPMVSERTRARVAKAAEKLGYKRNELLSSLMSSLKKGKVYRFTESIALLNANADEHILSKHPTLKRYCMGIKDEAQNLGYSVNEIWLRDPYLKIENLMKTLNARGIRGGIVIGHFLGEVFRPEYDAIWKKFSFVSIGVKTSTSPLELIATDHYAVTSRAFLKCIELGFKRPALIMESVIDEYVDGRFIAGFLRAQLNQKENERIPPFMEALASKDYEKNLQKWIMENKPDVILYLRDKVREILLNVLNKSGRKARLIQLENRSNLPNWMGMEQNNDMVGKVAMRRLADMLNKNSDRLGENADLVTLVSPRWTDTSM